MKNMDIFKRATEKDKKDALIFAETEGDVCTSFASGPFLLVMTVLFDLLISTAKKNGMPLGMLHVILADKIKEFEDAKDS